MLSMKIRSVGDKKGLSLQKGNLKTPECTLRFCVSSPLRWQQPWLEASCFQISAQLISFADTELRWLLLYRVAKLSISRLYFTVNIVSSVSVDSLFLTGIYSLSLLCSPVFNCPVGWQQREGGKGWLVRTSNQAFVQPGLVFCVPCCICELDPPVYVYVVCF